MSLLDYCPTPPDWHLPWDEMRAEYDFRGGVRGKYAERYASGTNVVLLDPDVAEVFRDPAAVNRALRAPAGIIRDQQVPEPA